MQPDDGGVRCSSHVAYRLWRRVGIPHLLLKRQSTTGKAGYNERNRFCRRKKDTEKQQDAEQKEGIRRYSFLSDGCI